MPELKEKQEKFCQQYVVSRNATKSAEAAGYSERSAYNQGYNLLQREDVKERIKELEGEFTTDVDVIDELEKQYEAAKAQGHGQTALKALELLSRVRGNNAEDEGPDDIDSLEGEIKKSMHIIGKEKIYELLMEAFPEDFEDELEVSEEELDAVEQVMNEDKEILAELEDDDDED